MQHSPTISACIASKSNFAWKPVMRTINTTADKNYWKCNLALIHAS